MQARGSSKRRRDPEEEIPDIKRDIGFGRPLFLDGKYCDFNQIKCVCVYVYIMSYAFEPKRLPCKMFLCTQTWRASVAELLGTAVLVFALDTIVISTIQTQTNTPNLILSTLVAIIVTILLLATYPISGGHINPVVTFAALLTGLISISKAFIYILAQCVGGIVGALALKAVVNSEIEQTFSLGGCTLTVVAPGPDGPTVVGLETGQALW